MKTTLPLSTPELRNQLPEAILNLIRSIENGKNLSPARMKNLLQQAGLNLKDLLPWANFHHPPAESYGRKMVYDGGFFEMMVMSWAPGNCSAIHDHGQTQWGAVQIWGPAILTAYLAQDGEIKTLSRFRVNPPQTFAINHELVHQMCNDTQTNFLSVHVYGAYDLENGITDDARIFDLDENQVQRTDGGVFFALPEKAIKRRETGPQPDFLTHLRHNREKLQRLRTINRNTPSRESREREKNLVDKLFDGLHWQWLEEDLMQHTHPRTGHVTDPGHWELLREELIAAGNLQKELLQTLDGNDPFLTYAELYDDVIGRPCLEEFISGYLEFVVNTYTLDMPRSRLLSLGCGTGLIETHILNRFGLSKNHLLGIDKSEAMIQVASQRIQAEKRDILASDLKGEKWDLTYCGLNVFQYLRPGQLEAAVASTGGWTRPGGYFIGDFITPDHIRIYPHVIRSKSGKVISLRQPKLVEIGGHTFQQSEIINVNRNQERLLITYEGQHLRYLPSLGRIRQWFETSFKGPVDLYDAISLEPLEDNADTCPSTRYLVVAKKNG